MSGGTRVYYCGNCPLVLELGGYTDRDEGGHVLRLIQVACGACGTMHRLAETEEHGSCEVTSLSEPVRTIRTVTARDVSGEEIESFEYVSETDWQRVGRHPAGIDAVRLLPCSHCGQGGRMVSLKELRYPGGYTAGAPRREDCPVCGAAMQCIAVTDSI